MPSKRMMIGALAIGAWCTLVIAQQPDTPTALEARIERLQNKIENIESVRAIKRLQYAYGHYTEFGLWNDFAELFTDDAATNYSQGARGKEQVRKLFFEQVGQGKLGLADGRIYPHILYQPVVNVGTDGKSAKGRWRILAMLGGMGGGATWYSGVYENEYVLQDGAWKISVLRSEPRATAPYTATGWKDSGIHVPLHYTPESAGKPIPDATTGGGTSAGALGDRVAKLAERAARLNDQAEVTNLQDNYGDAIDRKLWDQAANLFADNGTLELGMRGVYVGKASIRRALDHLSPKGLNDHVYLQTLVTVMPDGRTAMARGVELIFSDGELSEGIFENTFAKQGSAWKIQSVRFYPRMIVDAAQGWGKSAKPAPGPSKEFPPDRPPTSMYEIYPKFTIAPFHFDNPVTGKPPQYPEGVAASARPATARAVQPGGIRNAKELEARLAEVERVAAAAEVYDVAENLMNAYGYSRDDSPSKEGTLFASQILQPVIEVGRDGKSATVRARSLDLHGTSGGAGYWTAGTVEGRVVSEGGVWKLEMPRSTTMWSAPFPGGWGANSAKK